MRDLNQNGYINYRGRYLLAVYFIKYLKQDWRYGAAYFQQQLIDYDVSINQANWHFVSANLEEDPFHLAMNSGQRRIDY